MQKNVFFNLFKGRLNRVHYFVGILVQVSLLIIWICLVGLLPDNSSDILLLSIIICLPLLALWSFGTSLALRRGNDFGGTWAVSLFFGIIVGCPFTIGGVLGLILLFLKGDNGENKYGHPDTRKALDAIFNLK